MNFDLLDNHSAIGWDFDGTLVGHPASEAMHVYIKAHPEKHHYIITFRTHGMEKYVWAELSAHKTGLTKFDFKNVHNIEDDAWVRYEECFTEPKRKRVANGILLPADTYYTEWKAKTCVKLGVSVLVDDMSELVSAGCAKHGVEYINPDEFL